MKFTNKSGKILFPIKADEILQLSRISSAFIDGL